MSKRDIGQEVLDGIQAIKAGKGRRVTVQVPGDVKAIRDGMSLSQSTFAGVLGVSVRTVQEWEQGRRKPSGPAASLLRIAQRHPEALLA